MGASEQAAAVREAMDAIRRIVRVLREGSRAAEKRVGISGAQLFVLWRLQAGGPRTINELAADTSTHQSSVSVVVQRLVDRGLVNRGVAAGDARRREVALTAAGRRLLGRAPGVAQERILAGLAALPARRARRLADDLTALVDAMGAGRGPAAMFFEEETARTSMGAHGPRGRRTLSSDPGGGSDEARRRAPRRLSRSRPARGG